MKRLLTPFTPFVVLILLMLCVLLCIPKEVSEEPKVLNVTLSAVNTTNDGKPEFFVNTNLPDNTKLLLTLEDALGYRAQETITISNYHGKSSAFSLDGSPLSGDYTLTVSMGDPSLQDQAVQDVIGNAGEYMSGIFVIEVDNDGTSYISVETQFPFAIEDRSQEVKEISITPKCAVCGKYDAPYELGEYVLCFDCYTKIMNERALKEALKDEKTIDSNGKQIWKVYAKSSELHFYGTFRGNGYFGIKILDSNQDFVATVVNEIGDYDVDKSIYDLIPDEMYYIQIECTDGSWNCYWTGTYG